MRITVELEDNTSRVFENATRIADSIEDGQVTIWTYDHGRRLHEVHNLRFSDVAAWTEERP